MSVLEKERRGVGGFRKRKKFNRPYFWPLCLMRIFLVVVAATGWRGTSWPPTCWAWTPTYTSCGSSYRIKGHILAPYLLSKTTNKQKFHVSSYCEQFQHLASMQLGNRPFSGQHREALGSGRNLAVELIKKWLERTCFVGWNLTTDDSRNILLKESSKGESESSP